MGHNPKKREKRKEKREKRKEKREKRKKKKEKRRGKKKGKNLNLLLEEQQSHYQHNKEVFGC